MNSESWSGEPGVKDPGGRVLFESDVTVAEGMETSVRRCAEASVGQEFPAHPSLSQDVALVTSELVSNATRVARDRILVKVVANGDEVTVAVTDDGPGVPHLRHPEPDEPTGRGLLLVDAVADRWGVEPVEPHGKVVWARCSTPSSA
jgi:serine/threonine-protein kinase RsbW